MRFRLVPKSMTSDDLERRIKELPKVFKYPLLSQERVKLWSMDFKFGRYIQRVHPNKHPFKIVKKRERGRIQGLPNVLKYPFSGTDKATDFKFSRYIYIRTKAH